MNAAVIGQDYKLVCPDGPDSAELYDLINDEAEQHHLAGLRPETVAHLKAYYLRWYADVGAGRGFAPNPAILGNPAQDTFRESMIQVSEKDGLPLQVERAGTYEFELLYVQHDLFSEDGKLGLTDGKMVWQAPVKADMPSVKLTISLPEGPVQFWPWSEGKTLKTNYVPVGADPGCRQIIIRGPL
jgi:hypothetical protein